MIDTQTEEYRKQYKQKINERFKKQMRMKTLILIALLLSLLASAILSVFYHYRNGYAYMAALIPGMLYCIHDTIKLDKTIKQQLKTEGWPDPRETPETTGDTKNV